MWDLRPPRLRRHAMAVWRRNFLVWRRLLGPALILHFGEPLLYLLGMGYGLGFFIRDIHGMSYLTFLASGILASSVMNSTSLEGTYSVYTRMVPQMTYDAILATPLATDDILAGEMLWCATKGLISGSAILLVAALLGAFHTWSALWAVPVLFLTGLCFAAPAIVVGTMSRGYDFFNYYFTLAITPMLILSGVFYPTSTLPHAVQNVVQCLPLAHAVQLVRPLVSGGSITHAGTHLAVLAGYAAVGVYVAVVLVRRRLLV
jgi:lipooligosaccharide transport system permease protein